MSCLRNYKNWYLALVCITYSQSYFYRNSISAIADVLEQEFDTTSTGIGMLSSFLYGSYFSMQIVVGLLLEIYSFHILILVSSSFLGLSLIAFTFAPTVEIGIVIRFISGFITAPPYVTGIAMSSQLYGNEYVSMYSGLLFFCGNVFVLFFGYLQAYVYTQYNDWKSIYIFTGICSIFISILFLCVTIYEYMYQHSKIDQNDHLLSTTKSSQKQEIALHESSDGKKDYNSIDTTSDYDPYNHQKGSFWNFLIYRHRNYGFESVGAKLCKSLKATVKNKYNYFVGLQAFCAFVIIFAMNGLWIINYCMVKYQYSRSTSSIISGIFFMGTAFGALIFGKLAQRFTRRIPLLTVCMLLMAVSTVLFIYFTDKDTSIYIVIVLSAINGFGSGASTPLHYILVREYNHCNSCEDTATGFVNVQRTSSGFIAQLLTGIMIDIHWNMRGGNDYDIDEDGEGESRSYNVNDYNFAFSLCTFSVVIGLILLLFLKETHSKNIKF